LPFQGKFQGTSIQKPSSLGLGLPQADVAGTETEIGIMFGSFIIGYTRNPSLKQQLFSYTSLDFAFSE
ncbi:atp synthase lipid-binding mitochondrial, partial [Lynx pardinus]